MTIQQLRERRNALAAQARKLMDDTKDKPWTAENQSTYDELTGQINDLDGRIDREQQVLDLLADKEFTQDIENTKNSNQSDPAINLFNAWMRKGEKGFNAEEAQQFYNTMSTTTGSEGGFTVPALVAARIIEALKAYGGMRNNAEIIVTQTGNQLSFPSTDGTAEEGELVPENTQSSGLDPTFGTVGLNVYKYSSKIIAVPIELLMDSVVDVEAFVKRRMVERLGRITNKHFVLGTGTAQPRGIITAATVGKVGATGSTTTVSYDDLVDLVESVDEAYLAGGKAKFMFGQSVRRVLRKLKDTAGRPIWTPGYELGATAKAPDLLLGYDVSVNNDCPVPAANAKSIVFGDLSKYVIRDAMQISLMRFADSAYASKGQVGFLAFMRSGGNLTDTAAVKTFQHSAT